MLKIKTSQAKELAIRSWLSSPPPYPCSHFLVTIRKYSFTLRHSERKVLTHTISRQPKEGFTNTLKLSLSSFPPLYFVQPLELYNSQEPIFFFWQEAAWVIIQLSSVIHLKDDTGNCMICKRGNCHILNGVSLWVLRPSPSSHIYHSSHTHPDYPASWMSSRECSCS